MADSNLTQSRKKVIDIAGQRFGRLIVLERSTNSNDCKAQWLCRCDCGTERIVIGKSLRCGNTKSCGCLIREGLISRSLKHGQAPRGAEILEYGVWCKAKDRCYNPKNKDFQNYGARGITMCEEWRNDFAAFLKHIGQRPKGTSLDRFPNNDGNYEPGNVRWATPKQQSRNTRENRILTARGETMCVAEWAEHAGIRACTILDRLSTGWTHDDAIFTPIDPKNLHRAYR